jgi:hypothetical protein
MGVAGLAWWVAPWAMGPGAADAPVVAESPFTPVAPADRWLRLADSGAPQAWVVTAEMPRARLASLGLPFDPTRAGDAVRAELLLNPAGEVLAVRLAPPVSAPLTRSPR